MTGSSVLPVTIHKGKLLFLFGKENEMEDSAKGFSDFGGGVEKHESITETALREGGEELTGFLGDHNNLKRHLKKHGGKMKISYNDYHVHLFYLEYDENLAKYYNLSHRFLWDRMNKNTLNQSKLFEKIEIKWFSLDMMKKQIKEFRTFYQDIVKHIITNKKKIRLFISKCIKKTKKGTKKKKNINNNKSKKLK